jgi:hypothetical protein
MAKKSAVVAYLPSSVELSLRGAKNTLRIKVALEGKLRGELHIAQGSIQWWLPKAKKFAHASDWPEFINLLKQMPMRRFYNRR